MQEPTGEGFIPRQENPIDPRSINIKNALPINWEGVKNVARSINGAKDTRVERGDILQLREKLPAYAAPAIPMVASVIASKRNPNIPVSLPTDQQVKAMRPWLADVSGLIARFSQNWAVRFDRFIEKSATQIVLDTGNKIYEATQAIEQITDPKTQFVREIAYLYREIIEKPSRYEDEESIEEKVAAIFNCFRAIKHGEMRSGRYGIKTENIPLLTRLIPVIQFPPESIAPNMAGLVGAEIMAGIHEFLRNKGIVLEDAPQPTPVNILDPSTWVRGLAESFASEKLERVKQALPQILTYAADALPDSGPDFAKKVFELAENVVGLKQQGIDDKVIAENMFGK